MAERFDICTPRASRDGKTYWTKIGTAWKGDKGIQLVFDALPIPDSEGRVVANLFEPKPRDGGHGSATPPQRDSRQSFADDLDDAVPFARNDTAW